MKIDHIGLWTVHLEKLRAFYVNWFNGQSNEKYTNLKKGFESYFIRFEDGGALELMSRTDVQGSGNAPDKEYTGWAHLSFSIGSKEKVCELTERFRQEGYQVIGEPRTTGDGFFESTILDPDGNRIELVA